MFHHSVCPASREVKAVPRRYDSHASAVSYVLSQSHIADAAGGHPMDFAYTPQQEALRRDVREFIKENVTEDVLEEIEGQDHPRAGGPRVDALFKKIHARGWLGIAYPKE